MDRSGIAASLVARLNLGVVACEAGQHERARRTLERALAMSDRLQQPMVAAGAHVWLTVAAGGLGDWTGWDRHAAAAWALLRDRATDQEDYLLGFERAAAAAAAAGHPDRTERARGYARALREGIRLA